MKPKILVASLSLLLVVAPCSAQQRHSKKATKQAQPAAEAAPTPPPPPPTLAQMPASPPKVSFQGGQLMIAAQNSTLGDILKAVRTQTGATIDYPGNASERVVGNFGPAPARDVLTSLLNGSHFNYMLLGSATDPDALDRVILTAKSGSVANNVQQSNPTEQASAYNQSAFPRPPVPAPGGNTVTVEGQDAQDDNADDTADATDDTQADDQTDQADQTDQTEEQTATEEQQQQQQQDGQPAVKTPEQLLQQLQQRQQQLQQGIQPGMAPGMPPGFPNPGVPGQPGVGTPPHN